MELQVSCHDPRANSDERTGTHPVADILNCTMAMGIDPVWLKMIDPKSDQICNFEPESWTHQEIDRELLPCSARISNKIMRCGMSHLPRARLAPNMNNEHHDAHKLLNSCFYLFLRVSLLPPNTLGLLRIVASIEREQVQCTLVCHCPSFPLTIHRKRPRPIWPA